MPKTPDDIKKGLECCHAGQTCECTDCPYSDEGEETMNCDFLLGEDALALIQQLESDKQQLEGTLTHMNQLRDAAAGRALKMEERTHQLEAERDAAVKDIKQMVQAPYEPAYCEYCKKTEEECAKVNCWRRDQFEWRGVQKEDK